MYLDCSTDNSYLLSIEHVHCHKTYKCTWASKGTQIHVHDEDNVQHYKPNTYCFLALDKRPNSVNRGFSYIQVMFDLRSWGRVSSLEMFLIYRSWYQKVRIYDCRQKYTREIFFAHFTSSGKTYIYGFN